MKRMTRSAMAVALTVALGAGMVGTASAQIPVTDVAAIANQTQEYIAQYATMVSQLTQLENTLTNAKQQLASISGSRGLGNILQEAYGNNNLGSWQSALNAAGAGGSIGSLASQISQEASQLNNGYFKNVDPSIVNALQGDMDTAASGQAQNASQYQDAQNRYTRLQDLMSQIDTTTDLKGINELQARIQVENSMMQNQLLQAQAQNAMRASAEEVEAQKARQADYQNSTASY